MRRITGEMADIAEKTLQAAQRVVEQLHQKTRDLSETTLSATPRLTSRLEKALNLGEQIVNQTYGACASKEQKVTSQGLNLVGKPQIFSTKIFVLMPSRRLKRPLKV